MAKTAKAPTEFQAQVEDALVRALADGDMEPSDRIKVLAVAVRFLAVKSKLVTGEHGSAYLDDDDDLEVE